MTKKSPDKTNDDQKPDEDFWVKILAEAQTEAEKRLGDTDATVMDQTSGETQPDNSQNQAEPAALGRKFIPGFLLLNTYRIDSAAIKGGMGSVWKIHHTGWDVDLAMKQPLAKLFANEMMKKNFIHECQAWIDLGFHPNIVSCYYVRDIEGVPTIFSEWMENGSLENRIQDGTLYKGSNAEVQERLLDIAIQYARGLYYAHESGLIHQDVKPDNVLLTNDWQAKAADFGLAKARAALNIPADNTTVSEDAGATHVAPSGGYTPAYCSMEQMEGKPLTRRTDIYSWAVSVLEMYHGSRPWTNGVVAGLNCRDYFKNGKASVPESLQDLLARCMEPDPADRPHDFAVIEKALIEIYQDTTAHPYPRPEPKAAADTADSLNNRALSYLDMGMPAEAEKIWKHALELEPNHLPTIYNQGLYLWRQGKSTDRDLLLRCEASGEIGPRIDRLKGQIDGERGITDWKMQSIKTAEGYRVPEVAVSADGARIYAANSHFLKCWKSSDLTRCKFSKPGISNGLHLSQDSRYLLFAQKEDRKILCIADAETGNIIRTLRGHRDWVHSVCTHPDGIHCYTVSSDKDVRMWNMQTGSSEAVTQLDDFPDLICLSPDTKLLCVKTITNLVLLDARTLEILSSYTNSNVIKSTSCGMQFSPDSNHIYFASEHGLFRFHAADLSCCETLASDASYMCLCLDQDGTRMLTGDYNGNLKLWDLRENRCLSTFTGNKNYIEGIAASSDFSVILSGSKGVHIGTCIHTYRKAPWELCKAESYAQIVELQENITLTESLIQMAVESGEITQSLDLLKYAEEKYGLSHFSALRRQIAAYCRKGNITASYELGTLPLDMERAGSAEWAKQLKPMYMLNKKPLYLDFDPRGDFLAVGLQQERGGLPSTLQIWNAKHEITDLIPLPGALGYWKHAKAIRYSPSGRLLAIGMTGKVMVWNTEERKPLFTFESCPGEVRAAFSPDENGCSAAGNGICSCWN